MGISEHPYTRSCTILNRVASQVADTCVITQDSADAAVDGESLHGHAVRVLNIHNRPTSVGTIGNRGALFGDQRQSIHALNQYVLSATTRNSYSIRPLWIGNRQEFHCLVNRFFVVAIHG